MATVVIGDFENGSYDGWKKSTWENNSTSVLGFSSNPDTVTRGQSSLTLQNTGGGYWELAYSSGPLTSPVTAFSFDVTLLGADWNYQWTKVADNVHFQGGGISVGDVKNATAVDRVTGLASSLEWGEWMSTNSYRTITVDLSGYNLVGTDWLEINISLQGEGGIYYFDNFQLVPEPATLSMLGLGALALLKRRKA